MAEFNGDESFVSLDVLVVALELLLVSLEWDDLGGSSSPHESWIGGLFIVVDAVEVEGDAVDGRTIFCVILLVLVVVGGAVVDSIIFF